MINNNLDTPKTYSKIFSIVVVIVLIVIGFLIYVYFNNIKLVEKTSDKKVYSTEEKLEILKSLSENSGEVPSIEERRRILNEISKNKPADAIEYSTEGKLQILNSLQQ